MAPACGVRKGALTYCNCQRAPCNAWPHSRSVRWSMVARRRSRNRRHIYYCGTTSATFMSCGGALLSLPRAPSAAVLLLRPPPTGTASAPSTTHGQRTSKRTGLGSGNRKGFDFTCRGNRDRQQQQGGARRCPSHRTRWSCRWCTTPWSSPGARRPCGDASGTAARRRRPSSTTSSTGTVDQLSSHLFFCFDPN
jgi:hypothetical protein